MNLTKLPDWVTQEQADLLRRIENGTTTTADTTAVWFLLSDLHEFKDSARTHASRLLAFLDADEPESAIHEARLLEVVA